MSVPGVADDGRTAAPQPISHRIYNEVIQS